MCKRLINTIMAKDLWLLSNSSLENSVVTVNDDRWAVTVLDLAWPEEEPKQRNSYHLENIGLFRWEAFTMKIKQRTTWLEQSMGLSKNHLTVRISFTWKGVNYERAFTAVLGKQLKKMCLNCREYLKSYHSLKNAPKKQQSICAVKSCNLCAG